MGSLNGGDKKLCFQSIYWYEKYIKNQGLNVEEYKHMKFNHMKYEWEFGQNKYEWEFGQDKCEMGNGRVVYGVIGKFIPF